jgi:hypothetical protein
VIKLLSFPSYWSPLLIKLAKPLSHLHMAITDMYPNWGKDATKVIALNCYFYTWLLARYYSESLGLWPLLIAWQANN